MTFNKWTITFEVSTISVCKLSRIFSGDWGNAGNSINNKA